MRGAAGAVDIQGWEEQGKEQNNAAWQCPGIGLASALSLVTASPGTSLSVRRNLERDF